MAPGHSPCASCKLLRRRCAKDCIFAPYFPSNDPHKFAIVHKVFGASNVSKMLQELEVHQRGDTVSSLVYEANARMRDPVYGCVGAISYLQREVSHLQMQLAMAHAEIMCIQMQKEPLTSTQKILGPPLGLVPVHLPAHSTRMLTDDVVSRVSTDEISYPFLHNMITNHHHHYHNNNNNNNNINDEYFITSNNVIHSDKLKSESSSLWT
ncbi:LOB domain-containing protein 12-like [Bidens hawaiensis]|uniref:LOB domain-containing protein 12-like n=1 Tax=Bidens hawaiensis TaxID=980011 RepID=UPI00404ADF7C